MKVEKKENKIVMKDETIAKGAFLTLGSALPSEYYAMLNNVSRQFPAIQRSSDNFYKSHSQFMQFTIDVTCLTSIRSIKQILAEIEKIKGALEEGVINQRKKQIEIKRKNKQLLTIKDECDRELLEVEIEELSRQLVNTERYIKGAIRKISSFVAQYKSLMASIGKEVLTEEDYEKDEERYHIMTSFSQALNAARSRGGRIDEGNHIYIFQLGINGAAAQEEVDKYLKKEAKIFQDGMCPPHDMTIDWLRAMADKYSGSAMDYNARRGMFLLDSDSLHRGVLK